MGLMPRRRVRKRRLAELGLGIVLGTGLILAGIFWLGGAVLLIALWRASRHMGVPVIVYHSVCEDATWLPWADNIAIRPRIFARQMAHLAKSGWTVIPSVRLQAAQAGDAALPRRSVVLHFDDAYLDFWTQARPVLKRNGLPCTVFASSDFIDPSTELRSTGIGYMNAAELCAAHQEPLIQVACHGKDHARLATGETRLPRDPATWGKETAWLWSMLPGNKSRWFEQHPPDAPMVPQNDSALCARAWTPDGLESEAARDARVISDLSAARAHLSEVLGDEVRFLCWPFDRCDAAALANAKAAGFTYLTGGTADNWPGGGIVPLSRTHINDHAAGGGPDWIEVVAFRAKLEVAAGNLLFWPLAAVASTLRKRRFSILHDPSSAMRRVPE